MNILKIILTVGVMVMLSGCSDHKLEKYRDTKPVVQFDSFFNGPVKGYGVVYGRSGEVKERFTVDMVGSWQGNTGKLEEDFVYYSGKKQHRTWNLVKTGENTFTGTAADIIGTATGKTMGSAVQWNYVLALEVSGRTINLAMDDWMYMMDETTIMNRVDMKKFGIKVGEVNVVMQKK